MKIVSAAKFAKAERELKPTRAYGEGTQGNVTQITIMKLILVLAYFNRCICNNHSEIHV